MSPERAGILVLSGDEHANTTLQTSETRQNRGGTTWRTAADNLVFGFRVGLEGLIWRRHRPLDQDSRVLSLGWDSDGRD